MPNSDNDRRGPGDVERARVIARHHSNAEFGALDDKAAELPSECPAWRTDNTVSAKVVSAAYCKLKCTES